MASATPSQLISQSTVKGEGILAEEIKLLDNYLELEKLRFKKRFTYEVRAAEGLDIFEVEIPPLLVQPYVENAVLHGISGKASGGKVSVLFEKVPGDDAEAVSDMRAAFRQAPCDVTMMLIKQEEAG